MIGERWGVTDDEVARRYPCDDLGPCDDRGPARVLQLWRGITIEAPPNEVWRWLRQVQLAPYSYDWVDNLGRRSPRELRPLSDPKPGDRYSCVGGRLDVGRVLSVAPGEHLTATIMGALMSYVVQPHGDDVVQPHGASTRLLLKIRVPDHHWWARAVAIGDWPMARRQLKNLKALAEGQPGRDS